MNYRFLTIFVGIVLFWAPLSKGAEPLHEGRYANYSDDQLNTMLEKTSNTIAYFQEQISSLRGSSSFQDRQDRERLEAKIKSYNKERGRIIQALEKRRKLEERKKEKFTKPTRI